MESWQNMCILGLLAFTVKHAQSTAGDTTSNLENYRIGQSACKLWSACVTIQQEMIGPTVV